MMKFFIFGLTLATWFGPVSSWADVNGPRHRLTVNRSCQEILASVQAKWSQSPPQNFKYMATVEVRRLEITYINWIRQRGRSVSSQMVERKALQDDLARQIQSILARMGIRTRTLHGPVGVDEIELDAESHVLLKRLAQRFGVNKFVIDLSSRFERRFKGYWSRESKTMALPIELVFAESIERDVVLLHEVHHAAQDSKPSEQRLFSRAVARTLMGHPVIRARNILGQASSYEKRFSWDEIPASYKSTLHSEGWPVPELTEFGLEAPLRTYLSNLNWFDQLSHEGLRLLDIVEPLAAAGKIGNCGSEGVCLPIPEGALYLNIPFGSSPGAVAAFLAKMRLTINVMRGRLAAPLALLPELLESFRAESHLEFTPE